jgi:hypothetical protein
VVSKREKLSSSFNLVEEVGSGWPIKMVMVFFIYSFFLFHKFNSLFFLFTLDFSALYIF